MDLALHRSKRRRTDSVVTMEAFRPKRIMSEIRKRETFQRKYSGYKCKSEPVTPIASVPASLEDLRRRRALTRSTDILNYHPPCHNMPHNMRHRATTMNKNLNPKRKEKGK
ncbi:hypothetical protein OS493_000882 [Desmophyllum pertusum]|uniref:Uncharacterized protein n=1 Tax=Desmophyllum pertusum TaxID=174260 RepID=A0A9X0D5S5_9CNID|nr:hypothetical protein OS493_000882 [Desmophyllum pertusum]